MVIEARAPGEVGADFYIFAEAVAHHIGGMNAFGGLFVVGTAGGMNMMVAGPPAELRWVDPALYFEGQLAVLGVDGVL